jgi:hypothetical protein
VLQCRHSRFQTTPASSNRSTRGSAPSRRCSDRAVPTAPARLRCRSRVSLLLHVPTMQPAALPSLATRWSSPLFFIPPPLYPTHSHTPAAESTAAPLRSVTPHPKPTTALPAEPSNSTTDHSSGRSPTTPLRPSCREAPPRAPLPPVFLQPSHHTVRSPPTHHPSTTRQQPPSTCRQRCRRRTRPPDRRGQPNSGEDSPLLTPKLGHPRRQFAPGQFPRLPTPPGSRNRPGATAQRCRPKLPCFWHGLPAQAEPAHTLG